jgi:hypothetical protein
MSDPTDEHPWGTNQVRQQTSTGEHFRRGNAFLIQIVAQYSRRPLAIRRAFHGTRLHLEPLKTDMTTSLTARSQGLPVPPCAVIEPQGQAASPAQPRFVFRPVLDLERHFRNVVATIGVVGDRRCVRAASGDQDQGIGGPGPGM